MTFLLFLVTFLSLIIWLYLILARGQFWLSNQKINSVTSPLTNYPKVSAIIPARNEADVLPISLASLFNQDYQGEFSIILIDDQSSDDTGKVAQKIADKSHKSEQITIISGQPLEIGWTGKLWAMKQGITEATEKFAPDYFLFTDADIAHPPDNLTQLVTKAVQYTMYSIIYSYVSVMYNQKYNMYSKSNASTVSYIQMFTVQNFKVHHDSCKISL